MNETELQQELSLLKQQQENFTELLLKLCGIIQELAACMRKKEELKSCQKIKK
jgi:DNA repair exonuclease SbcCD ATPase subunit